MARGARVALQTALGAISGGLGGYQQAQARSKQEEQLRRQEERQQQLDMATLLDRGWMTPEQFTLGREEMKVTEPAQRMRLGEQELVRPRTLQQEAALERGRQATMAAKAGTQEGKAKQSAIAAALNAQGSRISQADRALIEAGLLDVKDALPRRGGEGAGTAPVMRDINDQVARFIAANMGRTRKVYDAEQRMEVERPIDVRAEADQLRKSLMELYGLRVPASAGSGAPRQYNNIPQVLDQLGIGGSMGATRGMSSAAPRASRPLEFTTTTGRTYRLPEE